MSPVLSLVVASSAWAADPIVLEGTLDDGPPDHVLLPFQVPAGIAEIRVHHDDASEANILDWGLDDPSGFRGWGGGNTEDIVITADAASRSYLAGPLPAGTWNVVIGKAKIVEAPAPYRIEITLSETATLPAQPERTPYEPPAALASGARWYAGDLHVHSRESGDASPTLDAVADAAAERGLDFVVLSDHNTVSQDDLLLDVQARHPDVLLIPGIEYTTYDGHAGAIGATAWVDHRLRDGGPTIADAIEHVHEQGALFAVNHPNLDLGPLCIGCAWAHDVDPKTIDAIEILTGGYTPVGGLFYEQNLALWDGWLDTGARITPIGGSDDHRATLGTGPTDSPIGNPTTMVWADELSVDGILAGLRAGRTVVKLHSPADPMIALWPETLPPEGEDVSDDVPLVATVTGGDGASLTWFVDGVATEVVPVVGDDFTDTRAFDAPAEGLRVRVQLDADGAPQVVTGHWWLRDAPTDTDATGSPSPEGCACSSHGRANPALALVLAAIALGRRRSLSRRAPAPHATGR